MLDLVEKMIAENDEVHGVCAYALFVDAGCFEDGMAHGLSDFDERLMQVVNDDEYAGHRADYAAQVALLPRHCDYRAAVNAISLDRTLRHALNARKVALYSLYAQRVAVLEGEATVDSLADYAKRYDAACEAYLTAYYASAGRCEAAKQYAERVRKQYASSEEASAY